MNLVKFPDRIVHMEQHFVEHIKIGMEMRRGTRSATEARFAATELAIENQLPLLAAHQDEVKMHLRQAQAHHGRPGRHGEFRQNRL